MSVLEVITADAHGLMTVSVKDVVVDSKPVDPVIVIG
jgi:hypothetical protein